MKKNYKKYLPSIVSLFLLLVPVILFAADTTINNPLKSNDVRGIVGSLMDLVAKVGGVVVVFFIIYSGFKFVMAQGNESEVSKAKDMFYATIIGGAILLGADVIANVVIGTVKVTTGAR